VAEVAAAHADALEVQIRKGRARGRRRSRLRRGRTHRRRPDGRLCEDLSRADDAELRRWLLRLLEIANDPRAQRYWQLLAVMNRWPVPPSLAPVFTWFIEALRPHPG